MFERGYWKVAVVRGVPVRLHWSLPLLLVFVGGLSPMVWVGLVALVLLHEAGHALLARRYGFHVVSTDVTGWGGLCRWQGNATDHQRSVIAWGGVAAQALLLLVSLAFVLAFGWPGSGMGRALASVFIQSNLFIMALNLLPVAPFDGAEAWQLPRRWFNRLRRDPPRWRFDQR